MKMSKVILSGVAAVLLATACRSGDDALARMRRLEPKLLASEQVDSCLAELRTIDTASFSRPADRARYALLHAMALDKNYIDTTDLSVIASAADYYLKWYRPSRSKKFYTWYYKARIEENARRYDAALDGYLHAEQYMGATNDVYRTRLYFGMERVYMKTLSFKDAEESVEKALYYAKQDSNIHNIIIALSDCSQHASNRGESVLAREYLSECSDLLSDSDIYAKGKYYNAKMVYYSSDIPINADSVLLYLNLYINSGVSINPVSCAVACVKIDLYDRAEEFIQQYDTTSLSSDDFAYSYYYCRSRIREHKGDYQGALSDLRKQENLIDRDYMFNVDNEIPYTSDKYHHQISRLRTSLIITLVSFIVVLVILQLMHTMRVRKFEINALRQNYESLSEEYNLFKCKKDNKRKNASSKDDIKRLWEYLIRIGNSICGRDDLKLMDAVELLRKRAEPGVFEGIISMLGSIYCGNYYGLLEEKGLGAFEIAYCMLGMELSTKELEYALNRKNLYNVNAFLKEKLEVAEKVQIKKILYELYRKSNES